VSVGVADARRRRVPSQDVIDLIKATKKMIRASSSEYVSAMISVLAFLAAAIIMLVDIVNGVDHALQWWLFLVALAWATAGVGPAFTWRR
jgi:hypothetical protein